MIASDRQLLIKPPNKPKPIGAAAAPLIAAGAQAAGVTTTAFTIGLVA